MILVFRLHHRTEYGAFYLHLTIAGFQGSCNGQVPYFLCLILQTITFFVLWDILFLYKVMKLSIYSIYKKVSKMLLTVLKIRRLIP